MIKILLLIALLVVAYLLWRNARIADRQAPPPPAAPAPGPGPGQPPQEMVSCAVCGLHLPRTDAVAGADGVLYCSQDHRLRAGG